MSIRHPSLQEARGQSKPWVARPRPRPCPRSPAPAAPPPPLPRPRPPPPPPPAAPSPSAPPGEDHSQGLAAVPVPRLPTGGQHAAQPGTCRSPSPAPRPSLPLISSCDLGDKSYLCLFPQTGLAGFHIQSAYPGNSPEQPPPPRLPKNWGVRARSEGRKGLHAGPGAPRILWERWVPLPCQEGHRQHGGMACH